MDASKNRETNSISWWYLEYTPLRGPRGEITNFYPIVTEVIRVRLMCSMVSLGCSIWTKTGEG